MAFSDDGPPRWGYLVGPLLVSPLAVLWFMVGAMGGGGCEFVADPANCISDYSSTWIVPAVLAIVAFCIAFGINRLLKWYFDRSH